ncbi:unnamed protein product [Adineta ricciae]|nr:unnamed protein product [Adineta ricciae]
MIKVYGVIGDIPALNMILNHKSHVGYPCCWFCQLEGVHINGKRQYYYDENVPLRTERSFANDSRKAQNCPGDINGRHGISILESVADIPLPTSIIVDYLHVTLLGHATTICFHLYKNHMSRTQHDQLDGKMRCQRFSHTFNRKIKMIDQPYIKATEIRNLLFYCILPMIRESLHFDTVAHFGLFIAGIRVSIIILDFYEFF